VREQSSCFTNEEFAPVVGLSSSKQSYKVLSWMQRMRPLLVAERATLRLLQVKKKKKRKKLWDGRKDLQPVEYKVLWSHMLPTKETLSSFSAFFSRKTDGICIFGDLVGLRKVNYKRIFLGFSTDFLPEQEYNRKPQIHKTLKIGRREEKYYKYYFSCSL